MWHKVDGMEIRRYHEGGHNRIAYFADGERISEGNWKRKYVTALETELDELHGKLAKIYEII